MNNKIILPTRYVCFHPTGKFSLSSCIDFLSEMGVNGIDISFDALELDDSFRAVLYSAVNRAERKGLCVSATHLPLAMPSPGNKALMSGFIKQILLSLEGVKLTGAGLAVVHPIARRQSLYSYEQWERMNEEYLTPICENANKLGISLAIENMPSRHERTGDHLYGSRADEILHLSKMFSTKLCWDTGHCNISGYDQTKEIKLIGDNLAILHLHDNDGNDDKHLNPGDGTIDWQAVTGALKAINYGGVLELEVKTSHIASDINVRKEFADKTRSSGIMIKRLMNREN